MFFRDYNPKSVAPPTQVAPPRQFLVSPITGEKIPADKIEEHMRFGMCVCGLLGVHVCACTCLYGSVYSLV